MAELVLIAFIFAFGACIGSFLNVVIYRMPRDESIVRPGSHCPACGRPIRWYDNVPIVSWLVLRGRCRDCGGAISPRYLAVEAATGCLLAGLYVFYFVLRVRTLGASAGDRVGGQDLQFIHAWPMFVAHAALLCGLLAAALVDLEHYIVPLPVMWTVAAIGAAAAALRPHPFSPTASAAQTAMSLAAAAGLALSWLLVAKGLLRPSFSSAGADGDSEKTPSGAMGFTSADGVRVRVEILRELLYLAPAALLAAGAWLLVSRWPQAGQWWGGLFDAAAHPAMAPRLAAAGGALFGLLIGGSFIWGTRILATLIVGREAMGMGDVHILAAVGAVAGWAVAALAFFAAPVSGLAVVLYLYFSRRQRELPYGPWLAVGTVLVMLLYDGIVEYVGPGLAVLVGG